MTTTSSDGRRPRTRERPLAQVLAERIEDEIIARGWPVGAVIGLEADLLQKYGVSRAVFREAARIVEHHGVAAMRRGPGGGLVVTTPDLDAVVRTVALQLDFLTIAPDQVVEARIALELESVRLAVERLTSEGKARIEAFLAGEEDVIRDAQVRGETGGENPTHTFHILLAELTGNPALRLLVQTLGRLTGQQALWPAPDSPTKVESEIHRVHARIAEAVMAGDVAVAQRRMRRHLEVVTDFLRRD